MLTLQNEAASASVPHALRTLGRWLVTEFVPLRRLAPPGAPVLIAQNPCLMRAARQNESQPQPHRALRVHRVIERNTPPASAGRMRISGRMADVCAELERLASAEAH